LKFKTLYNKTWVAFFTLLVVLSLCHAYGQNALSDYTSAAIDQKTDSIHSHILTIDAHNDSPMELIVTPGLNLGEIIPSKRVDFVRMKSGGLDGSWFAAYVPQGKCDPEGYIQAQKRVEEMYQIMMEQIKMNPDLAAFARTSKEFRNIKASGKRTVFMGIENGYPIGKDLSLIGKYRRMGFTYITLCHSRNNDLCDSSTDSTAWHHGLSELGKLAVAEMNRQGMMIDVSHASEKTVFDVLACSKAPIIASHSCSDAVYSHKRNLKDAQIKAIAGAGGFIGVCFYKGHVKGDAATIGDVIDHLDHMVQLAGIDHVGFGTDFDGGGGVKGCEDVSCMKEVTKELLLRGYSVQDIKKLWGENLMRVMDTIQAYK
jgi:microsomal dipeptidase-like Zn-dependent dipeptidase